MRWTEDQLAEHQRRRGVPGAANTVSTANPPFLPADPHIGGITVDLPMPPTTNNLFSSDGKRRFRSEKYEAWIRQASLVLLNARLPQVAGKVSVLIEVEEPKTRRRQDVANREKATVDLLVHHGVIEGDDQFCVREVTMRWADVAGVRVTVRQRV
jgi:Holliday junction resolvase RusA-like endonuclease